MSKVLLAGGDSFTWGNELSDSSLTTPSKLSWASLLAQEIDYNYRCLAKAGCGNHAIARKLIKYCNNFPVDFVAVMWSFPVRQEICIQDELVKEGKNIAMVNEELDGNWLNLVQWQGLTYEEKLPKFGDVSKDVNFQKKLKEQCDWHEKIGIQSIAKNWFEILDGRFHNQITLESIILLQTYLEKSNIPFVFSSATDQIFELINGDHELTKIIDKTRWINNTGFYDWASSNGYKLYPMQHPEERAHRDWVNLFYKNVIEKYKQ